MNFNLIDERWIPVLLADGRFERVGIRTALSQAGHIRQIAASNPMDNVALLRFLLAVVMWCKGELTEEDRKMMQSDAVGIPDTWLKNLDEHKAKFNLLGDGERFYQDNNTPSNDRPIGDLLIEFPTETKIAHFRHVRDKEYGLCPACCALGIVRFCGWANAYGGGRYTSAVNGPTPAYAISQDSMLLRTMLAHWSTNSVSNRQPPWICVDPPQENDLDIVTVFGWRSRRLWLDDPDGKDRCSYCGTIAPLIRRHAFTGNWKPPFQTSGNDKKFWSHDPHLILVDKSQAGGDEPDTVESDDDTVTLRPRRGARGAAKQTTLGFPSPGSSVAAHTRFWRRALSAKIGQSNATKSETASTMVTGPAANKGLYQDATAVCLLRDCRHDVIELMNKAVDGLSGALRRSTPNPQRQHPERKAALDALSPSLEARLRQELNACQEPPELKQYLQPVVQNVVSATTPGSPLRRREAMQRAIAALDKALHAIVPKSQAQSSEDDASEARTSDAPKPGRGRKKKGTAA